MRHVSKAIFRDGAIWDTKPRLRHNSMIPEVPCSGEVIEHEEFFGGTSTRCDLISVRHGVSICAGFRLGKNDFSRDAKPSMSNIEIFDEPPLVKLSTTALFSTNVQWRLRVAYSQADRIFPRAGSANPRY